MIRKITIETITIIFIVLWVYAALSKLLDYNTFLFQLGQSPYTSDFSKPISIMLPVTELILACLLLDKRTKMLALYASFFLMVFFTGYIYSLLHYSYYVPCSCGGILGKLSWGSHLLFNFGFMLIALVAIVIYDGDMASTVSPSIKEKNPRLL